MRFGSSESLNYSFQEFNFLVSIGDFILLCTQLFHVQLEHLCIQEQNILEVRDKPYSSANYSPTENGIQSTFDNFGGMSLIKKSPNIWHFAEVWLGSKIDKLAALNHQKQNRAISFGSRNWWNWVKKKNTTGSRWVIG